jgi:hypothetical protein
MKEIENVVEKNGGCQTVANKSGTAWESKNGSFPV